VVANFRPDALSRLADALSEDVLNTPAEELLAEAAEDAQSPRALVSEFDANLRRGARRASRRRLVERLRRIGRGFLWPVAPLATAPVVAVAVAFIAGAHYFDGALRSTAPVGPPATSAVYESSKQPAVAAEEPKVATQAVASTPAPAPPSPRLEENTQQRATSVSPLLSESTPANDMLGRAAGTAAPAPTPPASEAESVPAQLAIADRLLGGTSAGDRSQAFTIFKRVAEEHWNDPADGPHAQETAEAIVALARFYLSGSPPGTSTLTASGYAETASSPTAATARAPGGSITRDPRQASTLLEHAATHFANSDAQYELGRLYRDGDGVAKDPKVAARWFAAAATKGQSSAQASLGIMLVEGRGVARDVARGLSWLTLANKAAGPKEPWIKEAYAKTVARASESDVKVAHAYADSWLRDHPVAGAR